MKCGHVYPIIGFLPILTPPGVKPYDWLAEELTRIAESRGMRGALLGLIKGQVKPVKLKPGEKPLSQEELLEGEQRDSMEYWKHFFSKGKGEKHVISESERRLWNVFLALSQLRGAETILDLGTGYGAMLTVIAEKWSSKRLFALEISYKNLKAVRGKLRYLGLGENVQLVVGDGLRMPFRNEVFDVVESWYGLGNIVGFSEAVKQAYRVLKRGGVFTVSGAYGKAYFRQLTPELRNAVESLTPEEFKMLVGVLRRMELILKPNDVSRLFRASGFKNVEAFDFNGLYVVKGEK